MELSYHKKRVCVTYRVKNNTYYRITPLVTLLSRGLYRVIMGPPGSLQHMMLVSYKGWVRRCEWEKAKIKTETDPGIQYWIDREREKRNAMVQ